MEENDGRRYLPRFSKENFPTILNLAEGLKKVGEKYGASSGQVAIAWVLAQGEDIIPIVGTTKLDVSLLRLACSVYSLIPLLSVFFTKLLFYRCK